MQNSDLTDCKIFQTVLVEANMQNAKVSGANKEGAYLKYAKLEGTAWSEAKVERMPH
jgi:uncharacterized protein YjbI with pentapeptide repeats